MGSPINRDTIGHTLVLLQRWLPYLADGVLEYEVRFNRYMMADVIFNPNCIK